MTTIPFLPNQTIAPPFSAVVTLDGAAYNLQAYWVLYRCGTPGDPIESYYISLTDQSGNLVINQPLIGSPPNANIYLAPGIFKTSTLLYRVGTGLFEIGP